MSEEHKYVKVSKEYGEKSDQSVTISQPEDMSSKIWYMTKVTGPERDWTDTPLGKSICRSTIPSLINTIKKSK